MLNSHRLFLRRCLASVATAMALLTAFTAVGTNAWTYTSPTVQLGSKESWAGPLAKDGNGNYYQASWIKGSLTVDNITVSAPSPTDDRAAVVKTNSAGDAVWAVIVGNSKVNILGLSADSSGNVYVSGDFENSVTIGGNTLTSAGASDGFVAKLNSSGAAQWARSIGGSSNDWAPGVDVDGNGNVYVSGGFQGTATFGSLGTRTSAGNNDIYVVKLNSSGAFQWVTTVGDNGDDNPGWIQNLAVDSAGNSYVTGQIQGTVTVAGTTLTSEGSLDAFVGKVNTSGTWQWAVSGGSTGTEHVYGVDIDSSGNVFIGGNFDGAATFGSANLSHDASSDGYIAKVNSGGTWAWARSFASPSSEIVYDVTVDNSGNVIATGGYEGTLTFAGTTRSNAGNIDIFVAKWNSSGSPQWWKNASTSDWEETYGVVTDSSDNIYISGYVTGPASISFGGATAIDLMSGCTGNCWVNLLWKLSPSGGVPTTTTTTTTTTSSTTTTTVAGSGTTTPANSGTVSSTPTNGSTGTTTKNRSSTSSSTTSTTVAVGESTTTTVPEPMKTRDTPKAIEVDPGLALAEIDGKKVTTSIRRQDNKVFLTAGDIELTVGAQTADGAQIALNDEGSLTLKAGDVIDVSMIGLEKESEVGAWLFSDPTLLGTLTTSTSGSVEGQFEVPAVVGPGSHTLTVTSKTASGGTVELRYGIEVGDDKGDSSSVSMLLIVVIALAAFAAILLPPALRRRIRTASPSQ